MTDQIILFEAGNVTQSHRVQINDDNICEDQPNENFFSNIALNSGIPDIFVTEPRATVTIDDTGEDECSKYYIFYKSVFILKIPIIRYYMLWMSLNFSSSGSCWV